MTERKESFRLPISLKILLPLFIASLAILVVGWFFFRHSYTKDMGEQIGRRAASIANGIDQFTWIIGVSPELIRAVNALGAEKDVERIVIVQRDPFKPLAVSGERTPQNVDLETMIGGIYTDKVVMQALRGDQVLSGFFEDTQMNDTDYVYILPVSLKKSKDTSLTPGAIYVQMETGTLYKNIAIHIRQASLALMVSILFIAALLYWILQYYIFRPTQSIKKAIDRRAAGDSRAYVTLIRDDEIGAVGRALNALMDEQEQANAEAQQANQVKSQFLANMSHELRTPLNSMLGIMRLLFDTKLDQEQRDMANTVFQSSRNLLEIVNDILDLSKIEAGEMHLERIGFDTVYIFESVIHVLDPLAREKKLRLDVDFEKAGFPYLVGDPLRLTRVLMNMIGNGVKYTERGSVKFSASYKKLDDKHIELRCAVEDTGIGISSENIGKIFEKFVQADTSTTRKYGGTGLGLAITKELIELMGGKINVESEVDKGSTFWFTMPFEITDQLSEEKRLRKSKRSKGEIPPEKARVLVAEDHPLNQIYIKKLLSKFGIMNFAIADNGQEAVDQYKTGAWDIILMDCQMPEKSGYDATKDIRGIERETGKHVAIVAMTANAMVGEREKCLRYGMDDYISKPINMEEMQDILGQWLHFKDIGEEMDARVSKKSMADAIDLAQLRSFTDGDKEAEKEAVSIFLTQSDKNMTSLEEACKSGDDLQWREAAHMFKGGAGIIGAGALAALCEQGQHFNGDAEERLALFNQIKQEYERGQDYLRKNGLI